MRAHCLWKKDNCQGRGCKKYYSCKSKGSGINPGFFSREKMLYKDNINVAQNSKADKARKNPCRIGKSFFYFKFLGFFCKNISKQKKARKCADYSPCYKAADCARDTKSEKNKQYAEHEFCRSV